MPVIKGVLAAYGTSLRRRAVTLKRQPDPGRSPMRVPGNSLSVIPLAPQHAEMRSVAVGPRAGGGGLHALTVSPGVNMNRLRIIPITVTFLLAFAPAYAQKDGKQQAAQPHTQQAPQGKAQPQQPQHEQQAAQRDRQRVQQSAAPAQQSQQHVQQSRPSPLSQPRQLQQHAQAASHQQGQ